MVQCAHFAYDDEELSGCFGGAGGCWPLEDIDEDPEEDLFDAEDLFCFPDEHISLEPLANNDRDRTLPREERKLSPSHSSVSETTPNCQNRLWKTE